MLAFMFAALLLLGPAASSQTSSPGTPGLKPEQVPKECKAVDGSFPVDIQSAILWDKPELYKSVIPVPTAKNAQSFVCGGDKGTVYFFKFGSEAQRKTAATFIKPLLWGEPGPTADHPELVLESGDVLTVVSFRRAPKSLLASLQPITTSAVVNNDATPGIDFQIPGHGSLRLKMQDSWQSKSRQLANPPSVTLHFVPATGDAFDVQVTALWLDSAKRAKATADSLKASVERTGASFLPHAVEKTLELHELHGPQATGFYYSLTDNNPGPGEFTYLTQGESLTGDVLLAFTILSRTPGSPEVDQALRGLAEAAQIK
jgi:hypothetical protein